MRPPPADTQPQNTGLARALSIQGSVIGALVLRELHTRFGRDNIGYLWLIGEPLMLASVISGMHLVTGGHTEARGMHPGVFTLLGYCIFITFRGIFNRTEGLLDANASLLYHKMISIFDILVARAVIETAGCTCALIILLGVAISIGIGTFPYRPLYLFAGMGLMAWWSLALSLCAAGWTFDNHTMGRLMHPFAYFMIPLSGAFWALEWLPQPFRYWMSWNPMVLIFEIARYGQFETASPDYVDFGYVIASCAIFTYMGLIAITKVKDRIHLS